MGPNDVGVLRGIIGDGQSMNDEDVRQKAAGKRPGMARRDFMSMPPDKKFITGLQNKPFNIDFFTGKSRTSNPVDRLSQLMGKGRNVQQSRPVDRLAFFMGKRPRTSIRGDRNSWNLIEDLVGPVDAGTGDSGDSGDVIAEAAAVHASLEKPFAQQAAAKVSEAKRRADVAEARKNAISDAETKLKLQEISDAAAHQARDRPLRDKYFEEHNIIARETLLEQDRMNAELMKQRAFAVRKQGIDDADKQLVSLPSTTINLPSAGAVFGGIKNFGRRLVGKAQVPITAGKGSVHTGRVEMVLPTGRGLKKFAAGLAENLGPNISSGNTLVGQFEPSGGTQQVRYAALALDAYKNTLAKRHKTGVFNANTQAKMTANEQLRFAKIAQGITVAQGRAGSGGFMAGQGGLSVLAGSRPQSDLRRFTQMGSGFERQSFGNYIPEASGRIGIGQGLRAEQSNKWGILLGGAASLNQGTDRISQILGKKPDPLGYGETAAGRIKRLSGLR